MKRLLIALTFVTCLFAFANAATDRTLASKQEAVRQIDYTIGTFANAHLTIRISPALPGSRVSSDDIQRPSYQISLTDETRIRQTVIHRQGEKLFGEIQEEGTTFRFTAEASKTRLSSFATAKNSLSKESASFL